ncbi:hypothetical protein HHU12_33775 [Flammeovirga aprica JL-4]|uniref:Uncharacterized protein n=2 Tax=Flammeovirga aprica TaxID=29528 RepID=A0A7X9XDS7_9BACT|nr:hypothetical protein [Flammeovirga aprica JL-4]
MMKKEDATKYFISPSKLFENITIEDDNTNVPIEAFERVVLFNMFKTHQRNDYDYDR